MRRGPCQIYHATYGTALATQWLGVAECQAEYCTTGPLPSPCSPESVMVSWLSPSMLLAYKSCRCTRRTRTTSKLFSIPAQASRLVFARYATSSKRHFATWAIFDIHVSLDSKDCKKQQRRGPYRRANWTPSKWRVIPGHSCTLSCRTCSPYVSSL